MISDETTTAAISVGTDERLQTERDQVEAHGRAPGDEHRLTPGDEHGLTSGDEHRLASGDEHERASGDEHSQGNRQENGEEATGLYQGDSGSLPLDTRRALMQLLSGPFISGSKNSKLWAALLRDEKYIRSRLCELFLDVVIDHDQQIAFVRQATVNGIEVPTLLRRSPLTFIDSALILHLRKSLAYADANGERAVISSAEILEHLNVYERAASTDRAGFVKRVSASIEKMKKNNILQPIRNTKERYEISPTLKILFSAEEIKALRDLYQQMASGETGSLARSRKVVASEDLEHAEVDIQNGAILDNGANGKNGRYGLNDEYVKNSGNNLNNGHGLSDENGLNDGHGQNDKHSLNDEHGLNNGNGLNDGYGENNGEDEYEED